MTQNLTKYVNKTILVSIPALSGDVRCRPYKLTGVELVGLWLQSEGLASGFLGNEYTAHAPTTWAFFVPYSQIACVAVGRMAPAAPADGVTPPAQVKSRAKR
jgi:hypothetical protein